MISVAPRARMKYHEWQWHVALAPWGAPLQQSPAGADTLPRARSLCPCQLSSRCPCPVSPASPDPACLPLRPPCLSAHLSRQGWVIPGMLFGKPLPPTHFLETNKKKKNPRNVATHLQLLLLGTTVLWLLHTVRQLWHAPKRPFASGPC